jgi:hypothetical protein
LWRVILTAGEWDQIWHHVTTCDFPETAAVWCELGCQAGFDEARQVFIAALGSPIRHIGVSPLAGGGGGVHRNSLPSAVIPEHYRDPTGQSPEEGPAFSGEGAVRLAARGRCSSPFAPSHEFGDCMARELGQGAGFELYPGKPAHHRIEARTAEILAFSSSLRFSKRKKHGIGAFGAFLIMI